VACTGVGDAGDPGALNDLAAAPRFQLVEELQIGSTSDPNRGFTKIAAVDVDRDGQVYVLEARELQIRVYSPAGDLLRTIGRRGDGPGEFRAGENANHLLRLGVRGDTVWVVQGSLFEVRTTLFARDGRMISAGVAESIIIPDYMGNGHVLPVVMVDSGLFAGEVFFWTSDSDGNLTSDTMLQPRLRFRADGGVHDTVAWDRVIRPEQGQKRTSAKIQGFEHSIPVPSVQARTRSRFSEDRFGIEMPLPTRAAGDSLRVTRETLRGDTIYSRFYRYRAQRYGDALLDSIAAESARHAGNVFTFDKNGSVPSRFPDSVAARREIRSLMKFPGFQVPVSLTFVDENNFIWLRRERSGDGRQRWNILDERGNVHGTVEMPANLGIAWSDGRTLWAVRHDENDVPFLVRFAIKR
jgi:hypothetical protein